MLRQLATAARSRRLTRGLLVIGMVAAAGSLTSTASAANTTTKWYSIDQQPATASSPAQFLTATSTGQVTLDRYQSGEWRQQWTPVYPEWPTSPSITSSSPISDFFETIAECITNLGCPFTAHAGGSPRKYVNRMYAMCLTFKPTGSVTTKVAVSKCGRDGNDLKRQLLTWDFADKVVAKSGIPRSYTPLFGTRADDQGRCLDAAGGSNLPGTNAAALPCLAYNAPQHWRQSFRFLESGSATCRQNYPGTLCGLGAPVQ